MRDTTRCVHVGSVAIGGGHPIVVQSMTDTDTADIDRTVAQVNLLADAGSEIVRITVQLPGQARATTRCPAWSHRSRRSAVR